MYWRRHARTQSSLALREAVQRRTRLHAGYTTSKAQKWIDRRTLDINHQRHVCEPINSGIRETKEGNSSLWSIESWIDTFAEDLVQPSRIVVNHKEKLPEIVQHFFEAVVTA